MNIVISLNQKESNEFKHSILESLRKIKKLDEANEVNRELDLYTNSIEDSHFTGGGARFKIKDGAMSLKLSFNPEFITNLFAYGVKVVEKLYPIYVSCKGLAYTIKNLLKGLGDDFNTMANPFKPKTTAGAIKFYKNEDLGIYITYLELINEFGETTKNHWHCLRNKSGISNLDVYKLTKNERAEKFTTTVEEFKDPEILKDREFMMHRQERIDKNIYNDLSKHATTDEKDTEDEEN